MARLLITRYGLVLLWAVLTFFAIFMRPLMPVDETRYAAVAWEMWLRNDFLVPHLNGETYSHKPPLLFWLMQLGWWLLGVNDWSLRLISPLFSLGILFLTRAIAGLLWPDDKNTAATVPLILLGCLIWTIFSTLTMFDIMLTLFVAVGILALIKLAREGNALKNGCFFALAIGGGALTKGPVILLHLLPAALLAPWWLKTQIQTSHRTWYALILLAVLGGAAIGLCWAIPAGMAGGDSYRQAIFLGQTRGRVVDSFAHRLPWWWYLELLPLLFVPWLLVKPFWQGMKKTDWREPGIRFCLIWILPVFLGFSLISGKRIHYLLPLMPAFALLIAKMLSTIENQKWRISHQFYMLILGIVGIAALILPFVADRFSALSDFSDLSFLWGGGIGALALVLGLIPAQNHQHAIALMATASVLSALLLAGGFFSVRGDRYNTAPTGQVISGLQAQGWRVAIFTDKYHGQFQFSGRLIRPLEVILGEQNLMKFARANPDSYVIVTNKISASLLESVFIHRHPYKNSMTGILQASQIAANPGLVRFFEP